MVYIDDYIINIGPPPQKKKKKKKCKNVFMVIRI